MIITLLIFFLNNKTGSLLCNFRRNIGKFQYIMLSEEELVKSWQAANGNGYSRILIKWCRFFLVAEG
jgi:hypothetical protein